MARTEENWPDLARIPHPPHRVPGIGDVVGLSPATPAQTLVRWAREVGPIFRFRFLGTEVVVVSGVDLVEELVDESRFAKHVGFGTSYLRALTGEGLVTGDNDAPNWRRAHDILAPAFTKEAMRGYHQTMLTTARKLTTHWDKAMRGGDQVDVPSDMTKLTLETIGATGFGYEFDFFTRASGANHPFATAMVGALRHAQRQSLLPPAVEPIINWRANQRNARNIAYLTGVVDEVVAKRRASGDTSTRDLLGLMLNTAQPGTGEKLDLANIRDQVITFLVAGHDTTSGSLAFALYYLMKHRDVLAKAQEEVVRVWGDDPDPDPTYEQVTKLRYLRRVFDESQRLWPSIPGIQREAREDTVLGGRYRMRKGTPALVLTGALHRDPVWGANPDAFDPDRFDPERVRSRPAHVFKPFGTGLRACIGRQFALHEAVLVLGLLVHRYDLRDQANYRLRVSERLTLMPERMTLGLAPRRAGDQTRLAAT